MDDVEGIHFFVLLLELTGLDGRVYVSCTEYPRSRNHSVIPTILGFPLILGFPFCQPPPSESPLTVDVWLSIALIEGFDGIQQGIIKHVVTSYVLFVLSLSRTLSSSIQCPCCAHERTSRFRCCRRSCQDAREIDPS